MVKLKTGIDNIYSMMADFSFGAAKKTPLPLQHPSKLESSDYIPIPHNFSLRGFLHFFNASFCNVVYKLCYALHTLRKYKGEHVGRTLYLLSHTTLVPPTMQFYHLVILSVVDYYQ